jgi:hypothetical protein
MQPGKYFTLKEIKSIGTTPMNFVLGKERSGTTLLQLMLNAHSNIVAPPESRFIILLYYRYGRTKLWTEKIITSLCDDLFKEGLFRNFWGIDKQELKQILLASKDALTFPLVCKLIFRLSAPDKNEVHIYFDKNPLYYYFLPELNMLFPEAKYIHLVRDYRANLVSHRRVFTVKRGTDIAYRWMKVNMLVEEAKKHSPEKYYTLKYESLVSEPEKKMQDVCLFLNLPFEPAMAESHQSGMYSKFNTNKEKGFRKVHEKVFQPINAALIDSWRGRIPQMELSAVEAIAGKFGEAYYGYKQTNPDIKVKLGTLSYFMMDLKYRAIKTLYRKALSNFWLYYRIKRNVWRNF